MIVVHRGDTSIVGRWWWTVDRWMLAALGLLVLVGSVLVLASGPGQAARIGMDDSYHFVKRQFLFLGPALALMLGVSLLSPRWVRRLAVIGLGLGLLLMIAALIGGTEVKGARRWVSLFGHTLQPSEFVKPCFAVVIGWMLAEGRRDAGFPGYFIAVGLLGGVIGLLALQPDIGMTAVVCAMWGAQVFVAGLPMAFVVAIVAAGLFGAAGAYSLLPHVAQRVDTFLDPGTGDTYQVTRALDAFRHGGLFGVGPGQGEVKLHLPDAHTDFVFAVAGEEYGLLVCLVILGLFAFVVMRGFGRALAESDPFAMLAASGLVVQFGLQAIINIAVNLHVMPTKGMTLPFISYGGSSLLALALGMGMLLALTRRRGTAEGRGGGSRAWPGGGR